jgi:hypothetical protein
MATTRQTTANRRNALLSTGPRTAAGKARSSLNSLRHGIYASNLILPGEDIADFHQARNRLRALHQPHGRREQGLVDQIAIIDWKAERAEFIEASLVMENRDHIGLDFLNNYNRLSIAQHRLSRERLRLTRRLVCLQAIRGAGLSP